MESIQTLSNGSSEQADQVNISLIPAVYQVLQYTQIVGLQVPAFGWPLTGDGWSPGNEHDVRITAFELRFYEDGDAAIPART